MAKTFNMKTLDFNAVLRDMGIQYRRHGRWNLSDDLQARPLAGSRRSHGNPRKRLRRPRLLRHAARMDTLPPRLLEARNRLHEVT